MEPIAGEQKKRVVSFSKAPLRDAALTLHTVLFLRFGHRRLSLWTWSSVCLTLWRWNIGGLLNMTVLGLQDEADTRTDDPLARDELWIVQKDGDLREQHLLRLSTPPLTWHV